VDLKFKEGEAVAIRDIYDDTGQVNGVAVSSLRPEGEIVECRSHPPHVPVGSVDQDDPNENPSPHYLVKLTDREGKGEHLVWFTEVRLQAQARDRSKLN
jgi:hypothetical protein